MIINKKVLLCGLGRMGRIHKKYLDILSIENYWYDPFVDSTDNNRVSNLDSIKDLDIDRVVIATPEGTHHGVYKKIKKIIPSAMFLVEKPAILDIKNIDMLEDPNVLVGLVERFNPVVQTLRSVIDVEKIINIDFVRCSVSSISNQREAMILNFQTA